MLFYYGNAQKTVYVLNDSHYSVNIQDITTWSLTQTHPIFTLGTPNPIIVAPQIGGTSYVLENSSSATRFPFKSPASTPIITTWLRAQTSSSSSVSTTANSAYLGYGNVQKFRTIKFGVGPNNSLGSTAFYIGDPVYYGNGWAAEIIVNTDPDNPNLQETVIIVYDAP